MATFLCQQHVGVVRPTKEQVRRWLDERRLSSLPPPPLQEIRRQLGWQLFHQAKRLVR